MTATAPRRITTAEKNAQFIFMNLHPSVELDLVIKERDQLKTALAAKTREAAELESLIQWTVEQWNEFYGVELASCDKWVKWCEEQNPKDTHGINFHQGSRHGVIGKDIVISKLKNRAQESPKALQSYLREKLGPVIEDLERITVINRTDKFDSALAKLRAIVEEKL